METSTIWTLVSTALAIAVLIATLFAHHYKNAENKALEAELRAGSEEIRRLQDEVIRRQQVTMARQEDQITELSRQTEELKRQTAMMTGGDSYPILLLRRVEGQEPQIWTASIVVSGRYPLRNVVWILQIKQTGHPVREVNGDIDSVRQMTLRHFNSLRIDLSKDPNTEIVASFFANNGTWIQDVKFRKRDNGTYEYMFRLYPDTEPDSPLMEVGYGEEFSFGTQEDIESTRYRR